MGNVSSGGGSGRRRHGNRRNDHTPPENPPISQPPQPPGVSANQYIFAAATPYPNPNPNPNDPQYYQYPAYYPPPPPPVMPYGHHHHHHRPYHPWSGTAGRYPYGQMMPPPPPLPYVEHQKAVTIRNDINLKKETLKLEPDEENPNHLLVCFTFDATVSGRITVIFFAKEGEECNLTAAKEEIYPPVIVDFEQGLGQKFRQPVGTGIDLSALEDSELLKTSEPEIYHLAVKAEAIAGGEESAAVSKNSQITQAMFEKEKGNYKVRVVKQILWVNGMRYELQEIYGIGNNVEDDVDSGESSDSGKECVICLSEPRDTTVLPCRHMCMCSGCAKVLRFQTNRCPICRQPVERLLEIKVNNNGETTSDETRVTTN